MIGVEELQNMLGDRPSLFGGARGMSNKRSKKQQQKEVEDYEEECSEDEFEHERSDIEESEDEEQSERECEYSDEEEEEEVHEKQRGGLSRKSKNSAYKEYLQRLENGKKKNKKQGGSSYESGRLYKNKEGGSSYESGRLYQGGRNSSKRYSSMQGKGRIPSQLKTWQKFLMNYYDSHPNLTYGEAMQEASKAYSKRK